MNDPASPADEDTLNLFALPYFLTTKEGQRQSRARVLLGAFNDSEGITAPKNDDFRNSAAMALRDFIRAAPSRQAGDEEHVRFSEAILSALALGIALSASGKHPEIVKRAISERQREYAKARNKEHNQLKADALNWYRDHKDRFSSKDKAAEAMAGKIVPVSHRTVRNWLREPKPKP